MFIQTERTPNPATLKFLPGRTVSAADTVDFPDAESAERSPLASALFSLGDVTGVFFGADFIAVTKAEGSADWSELKPQILGIIMQHFTSGAPLLHEGAEEAALADADDPADEDIIVQIRELLESRIRPAVARDGGDIIYQGFRNGVVYLRMQGACSGCPSSTATLKNGIESLLKHYVPEVTEVRAV
ncbi:MAG TPA: NifU family protein [Pedomonas sp.]|uniref:NifU family protein n=1 Tax=Pedomonas sp. TaxID=2976421 RepID=UPI002F3F7FB2